MTKVLLDLDGVLVDFHRGVMERFGVDPRVFLEAPRPVPMDWAYDLLGLSEDELWRELDADFWAGLHWTPEGEEILRRVVDRHGAGSVCVATNPGAVGNERADAACVGKRRWLRRHLPGLPLMLGGAKYFLAHSGSVLVDDTDHQCDDFVRHGGEAILIPRCWNRLHAVDTLEYVRNAL